MDRGDPRADPEAREALRPELEALVLGGLPRYDQAGFEQASGIPLDRARNYWRALGFSDPAPDEPAYADTDVVALQRAADLAAAGGIGDRYVLALTRALGHTMARLADWQVDIAVDRLQSEGRPLEFDRARMRLEASLPDLERMLVHAWRRHLLAALTRVLEADEAGLAAVPLTVGFADLVGFTALTRRLDEEALGTLVQDFESWAAELVVAQGGRVIKTMGDGVMFEAAEPADGVMAALLLAAGRGDELPPIRVGMATGRVVHRMGDVFGTPVNLASRLTSFAGAGAVWADAATAAAVTDLPGVAAAPMSARAVRGLGVLEPWVLEPMGTTQP